MTAFRSRCRASTPPPDWSGFDQDLDRLTLVHEPVALRDIVERFPNTLLLAGAAMLLASVIGISLGILSARHPGGWLDRMSLGIAYIGISFPVYWVGLILILLFAFIGLVLAFISLHRMQSVVARRRGGEVGWLFVFAVAFLSGFGVYLGRFERWNSWDVVLNPLSLLGDSVNWLHRQSLKFTVLFGLFLLIAYVLLYSLTSMAPAVRRSEARSSDPR